MEQKLALYIQTASWRSYLLSLVTAATLLLVGAPVVQGQTSAPPSTSMMPPEILYGAAYYPEYMPYDRLDEDVALMSKAGITVVRMGESTWSLWEPQDNHFEYAWMDRVIAALSKAGIKVLLGTPTYSIPTWMYKAHPEMLARPLNGAPTFYGMRQNMDYDNPVFRVYAARLVQNLAEHYKFNATVIGWQVDNETSSNGASNADVLEDFTVYLAKKFETPAALNKAWFLNYWGQNINSWDELPGPDAATSTSYKLEWTRWQQIRVTRYLQWQADLLRKHCNPHQFITQDFAGAMHADVNEFAVAQSLDIAATNVYHPTQSHMDGWIDSEVGDFTRSLKHGNYFVTETNAQTTDWTSSFQFPPYDGQVRLSAYAQLASGANMVEYWHWASIHAGQETYWKGVLSHDLTPNRVYAEVSRTAHELKTIGAHLVNLQIHNDVAVLYSVDSANGVRFMPFTSSGAQWQSGAGPADYSTVLNQLHHTLYDLNVGTDFLFPEQADFSHYKLVIVPCLYVASDLLLSHLADYVKHGGHVLMTFKSGFTNENSAVRWTLAPGPLREAAGFSYQEFSNLETPVKLKDDPFGAGSDNYARYWAEFLQVDHAKALAFYDDKFLGRWPAITRNQYGTGSLTYEGTMLSDTLQSKVVADTLRAAGIPLTNAALPPMVHAKSGTNSFGHKIDYFLNYSGDVQTVGFDHQSGKDLLTGRSVWRGQSLSLEPWGVAVIEEAN